MLAEESDAGTIATSPIPLGRSGVRVASQQRSILHHGDSTLSPTGVSGKREGGAILAAGDGRLRRGSGCRCCRVYKIIQA